MLFALVWWSLGELASRRWDHRKHPVEHVKELFLYIVACIVVDHVLNHLVLRIQDDVTQLTKVLTDYLGVVHVIEEDLLCESDKYLGVLEKLLNQRIQDSVVEVFRLGEPAST